MTHLSALLHWLLELELTTLCCPPQISTRTREESAPLCSTVNTCRLH